MIAEAATHLEARLPSKALLQSSMEHFLCCRNRFYSIALGNMEIMGVGAGPRLDVTKPCLENLGQGSMNTLFTDRIQELASLAISQVRALSRWWTTSILLAPMP